MDSDVKTVVAFIDTMVGTPKFTYPARQNSPRPEGEFAYVDLIEEYPVGVPNQIELSQDSLTTTYRYYSPTKLRFRVGVVDTNGIASTKIMHGWTTEAIKQLMITTGFGFIKCDPISLEDAKLEKFWEARQGFSVEFYFTRILDEVVNNITGMVVSGEFYEDNLNKVLLNFEINE